MARAVSDYGAGERSETAASVMTDAALSILL